MGRIELPANDRAGLDRRELLRGGGLIGLGLGLGGLPLDALLARAAPRGFAAITALADELVASGKLPGVVASIGYGAQAPRFIARGTQAFDQRRPMGPDTLFRIYSMTKLVTGMAAMSLIDRGRLRLDQPISEFLPKFAKMQVLDSPDARLDQVHPAKTAITVRHLLTHTAGLGYISIQQGPIRQAYLDAGLGAGQVSRTIPPALQSAPSAPGLATFADRLAALPLVYQPGTQWSYSLSLDLLGRVIELAAEQPFDRFLQEVIFAPCGMTDTGFRVPAAKVDRLSTNYGVSKAGVQPLDPGPSSIYLDQPASPYGGSGLVSTARDYDRFLAMLVQGGRSGRRRVLSERAVRLGGSNLLPPEAAIIGSFVDSAGHGAGARTGIGAKSGVLGWSGAAGTVYRVDLRRGLRIAFYGQYMPSEAYAIYDSFPAAAAADLRAPQLI